MVVPGCREDYLRGGARDRPCGACRNAAGIFALMRVIGGG
jgi:hypothetical protein